MQLDPESITIFLDFYLKLSRNREDALLFLDDERHKHKVKHSSVESHLAPSGSTLQNVHFTKGIGKSGSKATSRGNVVQQYYDSK